MPAHAVAAPQPCLHVVCVFGVDALFHHKNYALGCSGRPRPSVLLTRPLSLSLSLSLYNS
jgi:hypothetical protein